MNPEKAHRLARLLVYGLLGSVATAGSPLLTGIVRGLMFGVLFLVVGLALVAVALAQLVHDGIVDVVTAL